MKHLVAAAVLAVMTVNTRPANADATDATLTIPPRTDAVPGQMVSVTVGLTNPIKAVRGLQFTLASDPPVVSLVAVQATGRALSGGTPLTAEATQQSDATIQVVLVSLTSDNIPPGTGEVLTLDLAISATASAGVVPLTATDVRIAGIDGLPLTTSAESGSVVITSSTAIASPSPSPAAGGGGGVVVAARWPESPRKNTGERCFWLPSWRCCVPAGGPRVIHAIRCRGVRGRRTTFSPRGRPLNSLAGVSRWGAMFRTTHLVAVARMGVAAFAYFAFAATGLRVVNAQICGGQINLDNNFTSAVDPAVAGSTIRRVQLQLATGVIVGGSPPALDVHKIRFSFACKDAPFLSVPCVADDAVISFQGNISTSNCVDTAGNAVPAFSSATDPDTVNFPNTIDFTPNATIRIPPNQPVPDLLACEVEFDVKIEGLSTDASPNSIGQIAFYAQGDANCTNGGVTQVLQTGFVDVVAPTPTNTTTNTPTGTPTATGTSTPTNTPTNTSTGTATRTPTDTPTSPLCVASLTCNGNGACNAKGECVCNPGYAGQNCDQCAPNYNNYPACVFCLASLTCNGNGVCNGNGQCVCTHGDFTGPNCDQVETPTPTQTPGAKPTSVTSTPTQTPINTGTGPSTSPTFTTTQTPTATATPTPTATPANSSTATPILPSVPSSVAAVAINCNQINIGWTASTDVGGPGLSGYKLYRNVVFIKQVSALATATYDAGLIGSTTYFYQVSAVDNAGNESARSQPPVSAVTLPCTGTPAPSPTNTSAPLPTNTTAAPTSTPKPVPTNTFPPAPTNTPVALATNSPTGTVIRTPTPTRTPTNTPTSTATVRPPCVGDCDGSHSVTVDELLTMVGIALGEVNLADCKFGIPDGDTQITVHEILEAVNNALNGCSG